MTKSKKKKEKDDQEFPGYPKYPGNEDITFQNNRVSMNEEGIATKGEQLAKTTSPADDESIIKPGRGKSESDVTREDLEALGPDDLSMDMGEDEELLKHRTQPVDFSGDDLDVPGADQDDENEKIGAEDEENNIYSLGSDKHEDLDERHSL